MAHQYPLTASEAEELHFILHEMSLGRLETVMDGHFPDFHSRAKEISDQCWSANADWEPVELQLDNRDVWVFHHACVVQPEPMWDGADWAREVYDPVVEENVPTAGRTTPSPYGKGWVKARRDALKRANHKCESCGLTSDQHYSNWGVDLHVHHMKPVRTFDNYPEAHTQSNLKVLCCKCHASRHASSES